MPTIIGIDPGQKGGIVTLDHQGQIIDMRVMPFFENGRTDTFIFKRMKNSNVFLERAQPMPKNGVTGMFTYGVHYGAIMGALDSADIPFSEVRPNIWTKIVYSHLSAHEYTSTGKELNFMLAHRLWPSINFLATARSVKPHEGLVDAALIAYYGFLVYSANNGKPQKDF